MYDYDMQILMAAATLPLLRETLAKNPALDPRSAKAPQGQPTKRQ